jgi:hypothetical protein
MPSAGEVSLTKARGCVTVRNPVSHMAHREMAPRRTPPVDSTTGSAGGVHGLHRVQPKLIIADTGGAGPGVLLAAAFVGGRGRAANWWCRFQ